MKLSEASRLYAYLRLDDESAEGSLPGFVSWPAEDFAETLKC